MLSAESFQKIKRSQFDITRPYCVVYSLDTYHVLMRILVVQLCVANTGVYRPFLIENLTDNPVHKGIAM